jgi:hypothetical protein
MVFASQFSFFGEIHDSLCGKCDRFGGLPVRRWM